MKKSAVALCSFAALAGLTAAVAPAAGLTSPAAPEAAPLAWKKCATKAHPALQCASLKVPLDHQEPDGRHITLALSRVPHTAETSQGPLLVNPGGPGGSGLAMAGAVAKALPKKVAAQYDVIGFDPRGVGRSKPALNCRPGHFAPVRPDSLPATRAAEKANLDRARAFADACHAKYADVLPFIDTVSTVKDMDAIRAALGAGRVNFFGYSYGTYLGAMYGKLHPHRVRRMALDSVVDPTGVWYDDNLRQNYAFDARHKALMAWIARHDTVYGLGDDPGRVEARWYALRKALAARPAGGKVGPTELEDTFVPGGYHNGHWPLLARAFAAYANEGDARPLVAAYEALAAGDAAKENSYSVYSAVQCRDALWPRDWETWRADHAEIHAKAPFSTWNNAWYNAPCAFWRTHHLSAPDVSNAELPPVLLLQATEDPATPYEGALAMHRRLAGSRLVVERGGGNHGVSLNGNACLDAHLVSYLATGGSRGATGKWTRSARRPRPRSRGAPGPDRGPPRRPGAGHCQALGPPRGAEARGGGRVTPGPFAPALSPFTPAAAPGPPLPPPRGAGGPGPPSGRGGRVRRPVRRAPPRRPGRSCRRGRGGPPALQGGDQGGGRLRCAEFGEEAHGVQGVGDAEFVRRQGRRRARGAGVAQAGQGVGRGGAPGRVAVVEEEDQGLEGPAVTRDAEPDRGQLPGPQGLPRGDEHLGEFVEVPRGGHFLVQPQVIGRGLRLPA
ncbi:hypothetical protein SALBM135S_00508 [Streptomyces alboniger]